jgi:hypothetical protein
VAAILYPIVQQPIIVGDDPSNVARYYKQWVDPYSNLNKTKAAITQIASGQTLDPFPRDTPEFLGPDKWWQPFSERLYSKPGLRADLQQVLSYSESAQFPESTSIDRYLYPFGEPKRFPKRLDAASNPAFFWPGQPPSAFDIHSIAWFAPLSEPKRFPKRLEAANNPFLAHEPQSPQLDKVQWWQPFSEPKRFPKRLIEAAQPAAFPNPRPIISISWYMSLSEPKRFKRRLLESDQHFFESDEEPPDLEEMPWFRPFSEPKRFKPELNKALNPYVFPSPQALTTPYSRGYIIC